MPFGSGASSMQALVPVEQNSMAYASTIPVKKKLFSPTPNKGQKLGIHAQSSATLPDQGDGLDISLPKLTQTFQSPRTQHLKKFDARQPKAVFKNQTGETESD